MCIRDRFSVVPQSRVIIKRVASELLLGHLFTPTFSKEATSAPDSSTRVAVKKVEKLSTEKWPEGDMTKAAFSGA